MASEAAFASVQSTSRGHPYISLDSQDGCQPTPVLPPLPLNDDVTQAAQKHLEQRYLELTPQQVSGPAHKAGHLTRCIFINTSLWNEPAMAPTAVVPTLPEKRGAECGYQQLELGDEEQLARYPVLQAIRSGIKLDAESYTRGSYQTVPIVPGGTAWGRGAPHEGQSSKAQAWLKEYMSSTLPSVSLEALGESCFTQAAVTPDQAPVPHAAQQAGEASPDTALPRNKNDGRILNLESLFKGIYTGAAPNSDTPVASSQTSLKLPANESSAKLPPRPPSTPGSDRLYSVGKRASEKALHRATQSEKALSKSSSWHADRGTSGGTSMGASAGSGISLTARNLVLKEKMEKKEKEKSQTKKHAMASRPESVAMVGIMDEEELEALAEEQRDEVPELPVHDDLELVLRASEMTVSAPTSAHATTSGPAPVLRPRRPQDKEYAMENSVADLHSSFEALRPRLAMTWPFELDTFQKEGVVLMEEGESVFVAAHTSAGKTVLAEYAFALAELHRTKAVYTAPVKAISNQKFRDLGKKFDVGLLTGDVQIKPEANCLIMTTEVLRSMLYRGANLVRDIEWVIFDEVHYISDDDRGIVYEEVIIMLPPHVNIVMLSATVPNKVDFADWVGGIRQKRMHICGTNKRPVPLQHNLYFNKTLHPVCEGKIFDDKAYKAAKAIFKNASPAKDGAPQARGGSPAGRDGRGGGRGGGRNQPTAKQIAGRAVAQHQRSQGGRGGQGGSERQQWTELIHTLKEKELLPCINFMFSKKRIAKTAQQLMHLNLCSEKEKAYIHAFIDRSLARLKPEDRDLPQIQQLRLMLASGVAMHHAGLLPIMKEVVEMLFCEGLVRVLFATDTFAMGVNAPARSVSFWHIKKPDGEEGLRMLRPDEYVQMAGRAGRRGLDDVGTVLVVVQPDGDFPAEETLKKLMVGAGGSLKSKFRLEYRMILSLLRVRDFKVEDMMRSSFSEFASKQQFPELRRKDEEAERLISELKSKPWPEGPTKEETGEYVDLVKKAKLLNDKLRDVSMQSPQFAESLVTGAVVMVDSDQNAGPRLSVVLGLEAAIKAHAEEVHDGGALGSSRKAQKGKGGAVKAAAPVSITDKLYLLTLHERHHELDEPDAQDCKKEMNDQFEGMQLTVGKGRWVPPALPRYGKCQQHGWVMHATTPEKVLSFVEGCRIRLDALQLLTANPEQRVLDSAVMDLMRAQESVTEESFMLPGESGRLVQDWRVVMAAVQKHSVHFAPQKREAVARVCNERRLLTVQKEIKNQLSGSNLSLLPEYGLKLSILKDLEFVSETEVVKMKGRVACEISTCECLIATEAIFQGLFSDLTPAEALSLLCCLVNQNKVAEASFGRVSDALKAAVISLTKVVKRLGEQQLAAGLVDINPEEYTAANVRPSMTEVTYLWAEGQLFSAVCDVMPDGVMEGDVVRTVTRLEHACQDMCNAARVMGNTALYDQFEEASRLIKRDIIFAASLYVS